MSGNGHRRHPELLQGAPRAVAAALQEYWARGQLYGALSFCNILCDVEAREISFIDAGLETGLFSCAGVEKLWYPASPDLAYLLYQTGVRVRSTALNPGARRRQEAFALGVLRAYLETIDSTDQRQGLLDESGLVPGCTCARWTCRGRHAGCGTCCCAASHTAG